jgi:hypothetical protein
MRICVTQKDTETQIFCSMLSPMKTSIRLVAVSGLTSSIHMAMRKLIFLMPWVQTLHFDILLLASCVVFLSIIGFAIE